MIEFESCVAALATADDTAAEFAEKLSKLEAEVQTFEGHIVRWGHQTARYEKMVKTLTPGRRVLVVDFKEKMRKGVTTAQRQEDYFGGEYMSLLGIVMYHVEETGIVQQKNMMVTSNDIKQDTDWFVQAIDLCIDDILEGAPPGVELVWWGDSGPHFHNNILLHKFKQLLLDYPVIGSIRDEYFEPGEAKAIVDTVFSRVGVECKAYIALGNRVDGPADLAKVLLQMKSTTAQVLDVDRAKFTATYEEYKGMQKYLSYSLLRSNGARALSWDAQPLTFGGAVTRLVGAEKTREKRLEKGEDSELLLASLRRTTDEYAGAADLASDLLDKKNGGVIKKNDVFKDVSGHMNAAGRVIVARLKTHLEVVYGGSAIKTRTPTGFIDLLIKAEIAAQLPVPPPPPGAP
jgi:hypothetical protein